VSAGQQLGHVTAVRVTGSEYRAEVRACHGSWSHEAVSAEEQLGHSRASPKECT
jgi:hypothetical protein